MNERMPKGGTGTERVSLQSKRERLAEAIYVQRLTASIPGQYAYDKYAREARDAAEVFYPDDLPSASVPMTKAV